MHLLQSILMSMTMKKALFYFEDLIANHPDYVGTYYHLGKLYEIIGRKPEAIDIYRRGMEVARKKRRYARIFGVTDGI
jgi:tetratricopeptide (TPR) repeat protein